jgi:uncharacterized protein (DUF362 family)
MDHLSRRDFLKAVGEGALLATLANGTFVRVAWAQDGSQAAPSDVTVVGLPASPDYAEIKKRMKEAVYAASGDLSWLKPNQTVAIKVVSNSGKGYPFTTSPEALKALIEILKEKEPSTRVIVADQPGIEWVPPSLGNDAVGSAVRKIWGAIYSGASNGRDVLKMNGLLAAAQSAGAEVQTFDSESDWVRVAPTAHWKNGFRIPKLYGEVDHVVNLVRPSGHEMAGYTGTLKSWYGWLNPDDRLRSHTVDPSDPSHNMTNLSDSIAEVADAFKGKTRLNLVAAIGSYADIGPDWGKQPLDQSMIIASSDMVAADAVAASLVAHEKNKVPFYDRALNWIENPFQWRTRHSAQDTAFWAGIQGSPLENLESVFMGLAQPVIHALHGSDGSNALGGWDAMVRNPQPGEAYSLPQIERARELGIGAQGGVSIKVPQDAPIDSGVQADLEKLTDPKSKGFINSMPNGGK